MVRSHLGKTDKACLVPILKSYPTTAIPTPQPTRPASCCGLKEPALPPGLSCSMTHYSLAYLPCPLIHWLLHGLKKKLIVASLASLNSASIR